MKNNTSDKTTNTSAEQAAYDRGFQMGKRGLDLASVIMNFSNVSQAESKAALNGWNKGSKRA